MKTRFAFVTAIAVVASASAAHSQLYPGQGQRYVVVNGQRLTAPQIMHLEKMRCGPIPDGAYWLNPSTGVWRYAGNPTAMGHINDNCYSGGRRPSLSERGLLYTPGDLNFR